ncbi:chemotaxis protein CheB [Candidatus Nitrospira allomarina]|uniref:protein-glutamate methylesterase n=1 Tax=Candidatus Nitrospira allomarina TaxID=3020900 RepID=A0AA96JXF9_9BACT|nr:chemotaxis protein CheB [Candidatus Nitrospira allomarina]WNM56669.1 chemotaxis protein CheB [Candidatus Nitrospira allomarina]
MQTSHPDIIVVGASAGGVTTLKKLVSYLPQDLQASIFVVLHLGSYSPSTLASILSDAGSVPATLAKHGEFISYGRMYIAPPDFHLLIDKDVLVLSKGPRENLWRPSIDTLFRSAAVSYGVRVVGVILTGYLDDGVAGLLAIQRCGGMIMVQDPAEAMFPDLPNNVLAHMHVDFCLPVEDLARQLIQQVKTRLGREFPPPEDLLEENVSVDDYKSHLPPRQVKGEVAGLSCPECGGTLWEQTQGSLTRYQCHVGHGFSEQSLLAGKSHTLDQALWTAFRLMEERVALLRKCIARAQHTGLRHTLSLYQKELEPLLPQLQQFRELLSQKSSFPFEPSSPANTSE